MISFLESDFFFFFSVRLNNSLFSFQTILNSIGGIGLLDLSYRFLFFVFLSALSLTQAWDDFKKNKWE